MRLGVTMRPLKFCGFDGTISVAMACGYKYCGKSRVYGASQFGEYAVIRFMVIIMKTIIWLFDELCCGHQFLKAIYVCVFVVMMFSCGFAITMLCVECGCYVEVMILWTCY